MGRLVRGMARTAVVAGTATAVSGRVSRRQNARWAEQDQQGQEAAYAAAPPPAPAPVAAPQDDMDAKLAQLKSLGDLKAQGILTDAEFNEQKARLLG